MQLLPTIIMLIPNCPYGFFGDRLLEKCETSDVWEVNVEFNSGIEVPATGWTDTMIRTRRGCLILCLYTFQCWDVCDCVTAMVFQEFVSMLKLFNDALRGNLWSVPSVPQLSVWLLVSSLHISCFWMCPLGKCTDTRWRHNYRRCCPGAKVFSFL